MLMLKEVGASGQISLGKKYAGQLFDLTVRPDGSIVMQPVKVVPVTASVQEERTAYKTDAAQGLTTQAWAQAHAHDIAQYNDWATQREPYAQRVRRWRDEQAHLAATSQQA
jgi:hypothetical protein